MNQSNIINASPFLRTSREFPFTDMRELAFEVNKAYIDTANVVNDRTIGIYPSTKPAITGQQWFIQNTSKQQTVRQVWTFTNTTRIAHGINFANIFGFSAMYGQFKNTSSTPTWMGLIAGSNSATSIPGQISFYVGGTYINFVVDPAAPALGYGIIVLEWLANV
jgi:hypothetical protein